MAQRAFILIRCTRARVYVVCMCGVLCQNLSARMNLEIYRESGNLTCENYPHLLIVTSCVNPILMLNQLLIFMMK